MKTLTAMLALLATTTAVPATAAQFTLTFSGTPVFGDGAASAATLNIVTEDTVNMFGGYYITGVTGMVGGAAITGLLPFEGPSLCDCFPEGFAAANGNFSISNTLYSGTGPYLDHGGIGFSTADTWWNLYNFDGPDYELLNLPANTPYFGPDDPLPAGIGAAAGTVSIEAVPEPASWAMMICGFGLVGALARRRGKMAVTA